MKEGPFIWKDGKRVPMTPDLAEEWAQSGADGVNDVHVDERVLTKAERRRSWREFRTPRGWGDQSSDPLVIPLPVIALFLLGFLHPAFWLLLGLGLILLIIQFFYRLQ